MKSIYTLGHDMKELEKEIDIMKGLDSDYIVRYYGTFFKDHTCWVRSLLSFICLKNEICEPKVFFFFFVSLEQTLKDYNGILFFWIMWGYNECKGTTLSRKRNCCHL